MSGVEKPGVTIIICKYRDLRGIIVCPYDLVVYTDCYVHVRRFKVLGRIL